MLILVAAAPEVVRSAGQLLALSTLRMSHYQRTCDVAMYIVHLGCLLTALPLASLLHSDIDGEIDVLRRKIKAGLNVEAHQKMLERAYERKREIP